MHLEKSTFDVIVIGGGHAGIEAAYAAARMGSTTALITLDVKKIGYMPCNPAVGGIGKGHLVYEVSALGGLMPRLCTQTYLQARMLNTKKGPAVQGLRLQIDKHTYSALSQKMLSNTPNLTLHEGIVDDLIVESGTIQGVICADGTRLTAKSVVITTGTFLHGKTHIGTIQHAAGRRGEPAVTGISAFLRRMNLQLGRLKTGTPPRLLRSSLNFDAMEVQGSDNLTYLFEFEPHAVAHKSSCYITHTNESTHGIIQKNLSQSAMYNGNISGIGPRYCPSIEDKIGRFPHKNSHHVFVEPESELVDEMYPNGLSTSLPYEVQKEYIRSIVGFENAIITKPGYAVEYDFVFPHQLHHTLALKTVNGLFLAGQINGTTGYEEAAAQGIVAGINAHQYAHGAQAVIFDRHESYIGVMIDDLVTMSVDEPYRMFTSRAEHRLMLRQDNVFLRLMPKAYALGLIDHDLFQAFTKEKERIESTLHSLRTDKTKAAVAAALSAPGIDVQELKKHLDLSLSDRAMLTIHAELLYAPYIEREKQEIKKTAHYKELIIPANFVYDALPGLSKELQQKLNRIRPTTIAQGALIPGMTPAALSLLIFKIRTENS